MGERARTSGRWAGAVSAGLLLAACTAGGEPAALTSASPTPTPAAESAPPRPADLVWPPADCGTVSGLIIDYVSGAGGFASPEEAVLDQIATGVAAYRQPKSAPHTRPLWLVVDENGEVVAAVGVIRSSGGWLADTVNRCEG